MADTLTAIYELTKPEVGASANSWGGKINNDADAIDVALSVPRVLRTSPVVGATTSIVVSGGAVHKFTVSQATSILLSGWAVDTTPGKWAQRVWLHITNGSAFVVTWPGAITWLSGAAPTLKAAGVDVVELFTVDNGTTVYGVHHGVADAGVIATAMLADLAVSTVKLADLAVTTAKLADGAVTRVKKGGDLWRVKATKSGNQTIGDGSEAAVAFDTEAYDVGALHDNVTTNTRITVPAGGTTGLLRLTAQVAWSSGGLQARLRIKKNGTTFLGTTFVTTGSAGAAAPILQVWADDNAPVATDYYELFVFGSNIGGNTVVAADTWFAAAEVR